MTSISELPTSGKFGPQAFTVLDIGGQKMQGVLVDSMFLQCLTVRMVRTMEREPKEFENFLLHNLATVGPRA